MTIGPLLNVIDVLVKRAPDLRAAGVASLQVSPQDGRISVVFLPPDHKPADEWIEVQPEPEPRDPLSDPDTYAGGVVPTIDQTDD